jgi:hypothetical protein
MGKKGQRLKTRRRKLRAGREANQAKIQAGDTLMGKKPSAPHWGFDSALSQSKK